MVPKTAFSGEAGGGRPGDDTTSEKGMDEALPKNVVGGGDDDLTLRAALYGVLFQSYADKV